MKLPVYVSAYCNRCVDLDDVGFFDQQLACFVAYFADLGFGDDLAGAKLRDGPEIIYQQDRLQDSGMSGQYLSRSLIVTLLARSWAGLQGVPSRILLG